MSFKHWLVAIGKSEGTSDKYSRAVNGVISSWADEAKLCSKPLFEIDSVTELLSIAKGLQSVDIYLDRNKQGKNMYSCALNAYIEYRRRETPEELEQDVKNIIDDGSISATEKSTYISARVGQGKYRSG